MILRYPFNLYNDMVKSNKSILPKGDDLTTLPDDDIIEKFFEFGTLSEKATLYLTKCYKEYKTLAGISVECDTNLNSIEASITRSVNDMARVYLDARSTEFGTTYKRGSSVYLLKISDSAKSNLAKDGYLTVGELKDSFGEWRNVYGVGPTTSEYLEGVLEKVKYGDIGEFLEIRVTDGVSEGVVIRKGKPLKVLELPTVEVAEIFSKVSRYEEKVPEKKPTFTDPDSTYLKDFVSPKKADIFYRNGLVVLSDLTKISKKDVINMGNIGEKTVSMLENVLKCRGLSFSEVDTRKKEYPENPQEVVPTDEDLEQKELPGTVRAYIRGKMPEGKDLAKISEEEILDEYAEYLRYKERTLDEKAFIRCKNFHRKGSMYTGIINIFEEIKDHVIKLDMRSDRVYRDVINSFLETYSNKFDLEKKRKFLTLFNKCLSDFGEVNLDNVFDFINTSDKGYDYDENTLYEMYKNLYVGK